MGGTLKRMLLKRDREPKLGRVCSAQRNVGATKPWEM